MATFQQRPNGNWTVKVRRKGFPDLSATFPTKAQAELWGVEREAEILAGRFQHLDGEPLLRDLLKRYQLEVSPSKKGEDSEVTRLKALQRHAIAQYAVGKLTPSVIALWRDARLKGAEGASNGRPVAGSTVNREMNLLHHVLEHARKEWNIGTQVNPVSEVRRPKNPPSRDRLLSDAEKALLIDTASANPRSRYLPGVIRVAWETAMRQGELVSLQIEQVNLEDQFITLREGTTKNDAARTVPLSTRAVEVLRDAIGDRKEGKVWPRLTSSAIKQAFSRLRKRAGVKGVRFHDSRHEATTHLVELGLSDTEVMSVTGHKSTAMMRRYTHLRAKKLAAKLG
jgi:integrase